jgi:aubergine-like protein
MVVVIVTSKNKDSYDAIKRICCIEKPVPSQVITSQILDDDRKSKSVVANLQFK